ncbi:MAG TPA: AAA family ATPase, partial [Symbiobacteriaceae bacterium]|nr:AAA family ATPase [Symbiobacteriaceae bacterium]
MPIPEVLATIGWGLVTNFLSNLVDPPLLGHLTAGKRLENHDLQRALHLAFVRAQEQICNQCLDHPELSADDRKLLRQRQAALAAERKQLSRIDKIDPPVQAVAEYTLLVTPTTADLQQKQADLSARLLAVAAPAEARDLPGIYRDRLQEQLFDWTGRFFMAQIKYDDTVFRALMAETTGLNLQLQVINQSKLEAMLHRLLAEVGGIGPRGALSGNLPRATTHFVGRGAELQALADALLAGRPGAIAVLHGFGGMGKSELAAEFARRNADQLKAGAWRLSAEGRLELLPLIGDLTYDLGLVPSAGPAETAEMRGRRVLAELKRRAEAAGTPEQGGAALLLLDNLDKAQLLAEPQINSLPGEGWLKIVATTRLGKAVLRARSLEFVLVDRLPEEAAVQLMRDHQTEKNWPAATAELDDAAAHELARELDGFTLAVETVAIYLGKYSEIRPADLLARLRSEGLSSTDALAADVSEQIAHREKQLALVLDATLERLEPLARTALDFAALLPPDSVPWPWLRALVEREHPEGLQRRVGHPDPWAGVQRQLEDFRLLSPTDQKEVARLHRLIGAHLVKRLEEGERKLQLVRE